MTIGARIRATFPAVISAAVLLIALVPSHTTSARGVAAAGHPCVVMAGASDSAFVRNFNPFGSYMDFTLGGVYEPLYVITAAGGGHTYPWLATGYAWQDGNKTLLITVRDGVKWSDGQPFTAKDVLFTFTAGKLNAALDQIGYVGSTSNIAGVTLVGANRVAVHFKRVDTTALVTIVSNIRIIPQHIWATVKNPTTFTNPNPVGTGPFTEVQKFGAQDYILGKNPYYWQKGKPAVSCIDRTLAAGTDSWLLPMSKGEIDWTHNFVAGIQKVYARRDPAHFHYYYATYNTPVGLFYNDEKYPWSLVDFRKALSMGIDRQKVYQIAEYGYEPPAEATGLANEFPTWVDPTVAAQAKALTTYNPTAAKALLVKAGFTLKGGQLYDPKGAKVSVTLHVISGWTDWVLAMQIIEKNLKDLGIDASVKLSPDYNSWAAQADKGLVPHLHWTYGGVSPYGYFNSFMSKTSYVPTGTAASTTGNWSRWYSPEATQLLQQFKQTSDAATQHQIVNKLQKIMVDQFPYIPVMIGASWYTYSTMYFTGWPTQQNFYALGGPGSYPDQVVVLTRITPIK